MLLKEVLKLKNEFIQIDDSTVYKRCRVQTRAQGVVLRDEVKGLEIQTKRQQVCRTGDFIVAEIDAKVGGYGFIPSELEGAVVSSHYFLFEVNKDQLLPEFLGFIIRNSQFQDQIKAQGSTNYAAIRPNGVLNIDLPIPDIQTQKQLVKRLSRVDNNYKTLKIEQDLQQSLISQLRQSILQEAVQGKLTRDWRKQNPKTEPAGELLKRIKAEKEKLIAEKKIKKENPLPPIGEKEIPYELPKGWVWCRLKELGWITGGGTPSKNKSAYWDGDIPWVSPKDMTSFLIKDSQDKVTLEGVKNSSANLVPKGSVIIVGRSGILKRKVPVAINNMNCTVNQDMKVIVPFILETNTYILNMILGLERIILKEYVKYGMTVHSLKYQEFELMPVPLPPLDEQKAIVAKVNQLMALCDALEQQVTQAQQDAELLMQAVLREVFEPKQTKPYKISEDKLSMAAEE